MSEAHLIAALRRAIEGTSGDTRSLFVEQLVDVLDAAKPESLHALRSLGGGQGLSPELSARIDKRIEDHTMSLLNPPEADGRTESFDVLVLTPKEVELIATLDAFGVARGVRPLEIGGVEVWPVVHSDRRWAIANVGSDGNTETAIEVARLLAAADFRSAALVGMAAGLRDEVNLGDVVVGTQVLAYDFVRSRGRSTRNRAKVYSPPLRNYQRLAGLKQVDPGWYDRTAADIMASASFTGTSPEEPEQLDAAWRPKFKTGVILAGSRILEDGSLARYKKSLHDRVLAGEMEGAGFAAACDDEGIPWLVVRGIADYGEIAKPGGPDRPKSWQYPAAFAAARLLRDGITSGRLILSRFRTDS